MSRHRIHIPIYALTPKLATQRKMTLYRNVRPLLMDTQRRPRHRAGRGRERT